MLQRMNGYYLNCINNATNFMNTARDKQLLGKMSTLATLNVNNLKTRLCKAPSSLPKNYPKE